MPRYESTYYCVTGGLWFNRSVPQFPQLYSGVHGRTYFIGVLWKLPDFITCQAPRIVPGTWSALKGLASGLLYVRRENKYSGEMLRTIKFSSGVVEAQVLGFFPLPPMWHSHFWSICLLWMSGLEWSTHYSRWGQAESDLYDSLIGMEPS